MIEFILNDKHISTDLPPTTVLLDFLRREKKLTGTKEGCREGDCGACTVLIGEANKTKVEYKSINSCLMPVGNAHGKHIVTVEGLNIVSEDADLLSPIQQAMVDEGGTQCGFCTPGFVISMTCYFINESKPNVKNAINALGGNICRCTGYAGIVRAIEKSISVFAASKKKKNHLKNLVEAGFLPEYFLETKNFLNKIKSDKKKPNIANVLIGGGTDLYVQRWEELVRSEADFISNSLVSDEIKVVGKKIFIGGAATVQQVLDSKLIKKYLPSLQNKLELFGSLPIRNRATVAGNIVNASPIGDLTSILLALEAKVHLKDKTKKTLQLKKFFLGYKTLAKKEKEIVSGVSFNIPAKNFYFNYEKISKRTYLDIASVNSSIAISIKQNKINSIAISAGGVSPIPLILAETCQFASGKEITTQLVKDCAAVAQKEISPISDARGSAAYKKLLLRQLIYSHFILLFPSKVNVEELL